MLAFFSKQHYVYKFNRDKCYVIYTVNRHTYVLRLYTTFYLQLSQHFYPYHFWTKFPAYVVPQEERIIHTNRKNNFKSQVTSQKLSMLKE